MVRLLIYLHMSNKKNRIDINQLYYEIDRIVTCNKLRGEDVTFKKLSKLKIGPKETLGDKHAEMIIKKYKKHITFG